MYGFYIIFICGKFLHYFTVVLLNSFNYIEYCIVYKKYYMNASVCTQHTRAVYTTICIAYVLQTKQKQNYNNNNEQNNKNKLIICKGDSCISCAF